MMHEDALSPEFKYFGSDVFSNVYGDEKKIEMPKSLQILGFSDDKNPAVPKAHENYVFRREVLRDLLGFLRKPNHDALFITGPTGSGIATKIDFGSIDFPSHLTVQLVFLCGYIRSHGTDFLSSFEIHSNVRANELFIIPLGA